ncbi:MAG: hypothetical protein KAU14_01050 [Thermoplasmata archaeon]|nr:hypothetical protein [Thermoplasmata archaeon]
MSNPTVFISYSRRDENWKNKLGGNNGDPGGRGYHESRGRVKGPGR